MTDTGYNNETCLLERSWRIFDYIVIFFYYAENMYIFKTKSNEVYEKELLQKQLNPMRILRNVKASKSEE